MGDRVYARVEIGGHVETIEEMQTLIDGIVVECVSTLEGDDSVDDADDARSAFRHFVESQELPTFCGTEVNYGVFESIDAAVSEIPGLGCCTNFDAGGGFGAGMKTVMPDGTEHHADRAGDDTGVSLSALMKARESDAPLAAIDALIEEAKLADGQCVPPFTVSPAVAAWLKIFGEKAA